MLMRGTLLLLIMATSAADAGAQTARSRPAPIPDARDSARDELPRLGSPHEELLDRAAIKSMEATHKETVERARESALLGGELRAAFEQNRALSREDLKKLERLEKLARGIRGRAGGSDDDERPADLPTDIEAALSKLAELSDDLRKQVEKTSRHVVSAGVIERSNEVIELIRRIRTLSR